MLITGLASLIAALAGSVQAAPTITAIDADVPVFAENWVVGEDPLGRIVFTFSEPVNVPADAVFAYTVDALPREIDVSPVNVATTGLAVVFDIPVSSNSVTIVIRDGLVKSAADNAALDGEIGDPRQPALPSGDGVAGGTTAVRFVVLVGDANRSGEVNIQDIIFVGAIASNGNPCAGDEAFDVRADLDNDGCVTDADLGIAANNQGAELVAAADADGDGAGDAFDNCPDVANADQADGDDDGPGDACDNCPTEANTGQGDEDSDDVGDDCDNCLGEANSDQADPDNDGVGSACEQCPNDPDKLVPGVCGCGVPDEDSDNDTLLDCQDNCPEDSNPGQADADQDNVGDACDECPGHPDTADADDDGVPDACDNCPTVANPNQANTDGDGLGNACDNCPNVTNPGQQNADSDGFGDACDNCPDFANANVADTDTDGVGNVCDNCPTVANPNQADADTDGFGDVCDNCPQLANPGQKPDDCIADEDGDGVLDGDDVCPQSPDGAEVDEDGCTEIQMALRDDDGDHVLNGVDRCPNTAAGASVDEEGCSADQGGSLPPPSPPPTPPPGDELSDADGDSVRNEYDLCPGTQPGVLVDATGCPMESSSTPPPQDIPEGECGSGITCGAIGLVNIYAVLLGLGWMRRSTRRR